MADKRISDLTAATTPLAGTEELPIVQGGVTTKTTAQDIADLAGGGGGGIFGIADATGTYTYYSDLSTAIAAATSGDVIVLFTNYTETASTVVTLKDGVNINLNGHTYEYSTADTNFTLTDGGVAATITLFNGIIKRSGSSAPTDTVGGTLRISNSSSKITLQGVTVIAEDGSNTCYMTAGNLTGGNFRQIGATAGANRGFLANGGTVVVSSVNIHSDSKENIITLGLCINVYGRSDGGKGLIIGSGGKGRNSVGYSTANYGLEVIGDAINCKGYSTANNGIFASGNIAQCTGYSTGGVGITHNKEASNCYGYSTTSYGINGTSNSNSIGYGNIAISTASQAYLTVNDLIKCSGISQWNNASGHGLRCTFANVQFIDCYAETVNTSANGLFAPAVSVYVINLKGKGMTTLLNIVANLQTNTPDTYNNILIG